MKSASQKNILDPPENGKSPRKNSQDLAFRQLREMIVRCKLSPGTWMIEADIADRFGLSRTPVRGALHWLQREGYVVSSGKGSKTRMVVAPMTKEDAQELYAIIGHLEGLGSRQTALLSSDARLKVVRELREINAALAELSRAKRSEPNRIFELDLSFHRTIMEASSGPRLIEIHRTIHPQAERYWRLYAGAIVDKLDASVAEHNHIIKALATGDPNKAEKGMQVNWQNGVERLSAVIDSLGERGSW
ncbi:MAG: GntR family transcriptional regulator [Acidobacteriaceae bacterium]|nr:GntR family transcriptional regulator [Acidobacteriaceae bacterium]